LYCGFSIISNIAIPELAQSNRDKGWFSFTLESVQPQSRDFSHTNYWQSPSGEVVLAYGRQDSYHWLRFPGFADFCISANAREISCHPLPGIPSETLRHLLLDQVLPRCLAHQGKIMVYASAVQFEQGLLLFIGDSGAGKSTLAGNFHRASQPYQTIVSGSKKIKIGS